MGRQLCRESISGYKGERETGSMNKFDARNDMLFNNGSALLNMTILVVLLWPGHDRAWLLDFADSHSGASTFYYAQTFQLAASMYSALLLTLKEKKLINRDSERKIQSFMSSIIFATTLVLVTNL